MRLPRLAALGATAAAAALILSGCAGSAQPAGAGDATGESTVVRLGSTDASQGQWKVLTDLLAKENITLEIVAYDTYDTPNPAVADGTVDLNAFQHIDFLSDYNVANPDKALAVVGPTLIVPLPIYSKEYDDVADIPEGARVAIPNDATNQARALKVLQAAKLIELDPEATSPTPADIVSNKVKVEAVDASQTAPALNDPQIAAAIVNNNFALDAGILEYEIFSQPIDDADSWPYINIIASRQGEEDNPVYQKVWELYHDPSVTKIVVEESGDTAVIVTEPAEKVRGWLTEVEALKK